MEKSPEQADLRSVGDSSLNESWAGQVFQRKDLSYDEAMEAYIQKRAEVKEKKEEKSEDPFRKARLDLRTREEQLRIERRVMRERRKVEDEEWRKKREERRAFKKEWQNLPAEEKKNRGEEKKAREKEWQECKAIRHQIKEQREAEDAKWRARRAELRIQKEELKGLIARLIPTFLAILVVLDNCTRKCLALPLFVAGRKVDADTIVKALRAILPRSLKYLISDNGPQFISQAFKNLAGDAEFIHIRITPRRPKTNGIAERFIRTFKEMLFQYTWNDAGELGDILPKIISEYNDRPHQGRELNGISPNEYERRLLSAACS